MFNWTAPRRKQKDTPSAETKAVAAGGVELDAILVRLKTMQDGGLRIELDLPELEPVTVALLYALRNRAVKITIK